MYEVSDLSSGLSSGLSLPYFSLLLLLTFLCDVCRAHMRTVSTASTFTAVTATLTRHRLSNSCQKSISPAWTRETERWRHAISALHASPLTYSRSIHPNCRASRTGREITIWRQFLSNFEGTHVSSPLQQPLTNLPSSRYMALPQHKKLQQPKEGETF
jgi:hypothetical protein